MEVDRISRMGGVRPEAIPAWQQSANRRRKFVEEVPESESEAEEREEAAAEAADPAEDRGTELDVVA
jgi:hypothetical protein